MSKKTLLIFFILLLFLPASSLYANYTLEDDPKTNPSGTLRPANLPTFYKTDDKIKTYSSRSTSIVIIMLLEYFLQMSGAVAVFFIIYSGFRYVTSFGQESALTPAKKQFTYAIVGLITILFSYAIVENVIRQLLQIDTPPSSP